MGCVCVYEYNISIERKNRETNYGIVNIKYHTHDVLCVCVCVVCHQFWWPNAEET